MLQEKASKCSLSIVDKTMSSGVQPSKTKSLESSKRKIKSSEQVSNAELQAASSLADMSRKKAKKDVKKVVSSEVRRVPSAFDDDLFMEPSQKGPFFWPLLRFNFREHFPSASENVFVDIDSFSDVAPEVQKEMIPTLLLSPLLLLLILLFPSLSILKMKHLPNLTRSLNSPFTEVKIPSKTLPCSKFARISLKAKLPLLP
jgi:hypothetical protein